MQFCVAATRYAGASAKRLTDLGGKLALGDASLQAGADDFGHIVHRLPTAVLNPDSIEDVMKMVRFANRHGMKIAMKGNGQSCFGYALH